MCWRSRTYSRRSRVGRRLRRRDGCSAGVVLSPAPLVRPAVPWLATRSSASWVNSDMARQCAATSSTAPCRPWNTCYPRLQRLDKRGSQEAGGAHGPTQQQLSCSDGRFVFVLQSTTRFDRIFSQLTPCAKPTSVAAAAHNGRFGRHKAPRRGCCAMFSRCSK